MTAPAPTTSWTHTRQSAGRRNASPGARPGRTARTSAPTGW
ncbi:MULTISPECIES: hypothetical protein [Streptomyces]|nr:hypothetical protein [Streptomyces sp. F-3]